MDDELKMKIKYLQLTGLEERWDDLIAECDKAHLSSPQFIRHIINALYEIRTQRARAARLSSAKIPEPWVMATYPFAKQPKINKWKIITIHDSLDYMTKKQNILLVGPTGVGKTGLGTAFLMHAI